MAQSRSTLLVYNTADRLLHGDLFHTVTPQNVMDDLAAYPADFPIVGVGTTNWLRRNGEVIVDGRIDTPRFFWADPEGMPVGQILNLCFETPTDHGTPLITPRVDDDDRQAHFPFLVVAIGDPANALMLSASNVASAHEWLIGEMSQRNIGVAGVQVRGTMGTVKLADAYNVPLTGLDLSKGYVGEDYFRFCEFSVSEWRLNGVYAANASLQPFFSVVGVPLHLHGYRPDALEGGHIVSAQVLEATATLWPLDDLVLKIHDVSRAINPVQAG